MGHLMQTLEQTPRWQLANVRLGGRLLGYLRERIAAGWSLKAIATELTDVYEVPVSRETIRRWCKGARIT